MVNNVDQSYGRLFWRFLRFGLLAWGGPVAQIGMIRHELVDQEKWVTNERFNRVLAVYQALPGPEAHELCVYFGTFAKGRWGGLLAGLAFMLPGTLFMLILAWFYVNYGIASPLFAAIFYGMQPAVTALIARGLQRIGGHALYDRWLWAIAVVSLLLNLLTVNFIIVLGIAGLFYVLVRRGYPTGAIVFAVGAIAIALGLRLGWPLDFANLFVNEGLANSNQTASVLRHPSNSALLFSGLRTGLLTFGGAYSAISFLRHDAVVVGQWLTDSQFLDGIAIGGILPAPPIIFGTFVGYLGNGLVGALLMTLGIFAPAFAFSLIGHEWIERLVENKALHTFLDGLTAGVVGLIAGTLIVLLRITVTDLPTAIIFALGLLVLSRWKSKWNTPAIMLIGAGIGWIVRTFLG